MLGNTETKAEYSALATRIQFCVESVGQLNILSEKTGIPVRTISNYLSGRNDVKTGALVKIAKTAGVTVEWLATGEGKPHKPDEEEDCLSDEYIKKNYIRLDNVKAAALAFHTHIKKTKQKIPPEKAADIIVLLAQIAAEDDDENVDETNLVRLIDLTR